MTEPDLKTLSLIPPRTRFYDKSIARLIEVAVAVAIFIAPAIVLGVWVAVVRWVR
jgi:hypothetical protein